MNIYKSTIFTNKHHFLTARTARTTCKNQKQNRLAVLTVDKCSVVNTVVTINLSPKLDWLLDLNSIATFNSLVLTEYTDPEVYNIKITDLYFLNQMVQIAEI